MTFKDCLATAVDGGELTQDEAQRLARDFDRLRARYATNSEATADAEAKKALAQLLKAETDHQRRKAKLAISSIRRIDADIRSYKNAAGKADIAAAATDLLEHFGTAPFSSVEGRRKAIVGMAHGKIDSLLYNFRRGAIGGDKARHNKAQLDNVVREAFGENSGDKAAKEFAKAWEETHEWLRQRFNAAGGAIGKLEKWGLPQHHDARALRKRGMVAWKADIRPMLDVARMRHPLTGEAVDERELDAILSEVWETIATEGWNQRQPTRQAFGRGALANQRAEHRFLVFRDATSWMEYQRNYGGGGDAFAAMMGHINMMAKDIAAMEVLGPNPDGTIEWLKQAIEKEARNALSGKPSRFNGQPDNALDRANGATTRLDALWGSLRGSLETPVNGKWAAGLAAGRSLITASILGSAAIASVSDIGTSIIARRFAGIGGSGAFNDLAKAIMPATRQEAVAAGLILDNAMHVFHAQARYVGTLDGPGWSSYLADRVLTYSGLTPWTQAGRHAFGLAFMRTAAEQAGRDFEKLPDALRNVMKRYGISPREWDQMRKLPMHDMGSGAMILRPQEIDARVHPKLAEKYLEMIQSETEYAIPSGSNRSKIMWLNENRPGTFVGELLRSFVQFKSFGTVFLLLHGQRIHGMIAGGETAKGAVYAGSLLLSTTLFGAMALQMKQVAAGRDPQDMNPFSDPAFWGAAMLQGGGLGIYGDFLFSNINRYGGGFTTTLGGPLLQRANDLWNLTAGNVAQLASGEKTHFGREATKFLRGNIPGSTIWYTRLAWERIVMDQLQFLVDPEANKAFKQRQKFFAREFDQKFWWTPGELTPDRAPDLTAAGG
jgi:polyhydroxyalkanoate synthesis regulator phasin